MRFDSSIFKTLKATIRPINELIKRFNYKGEKYDKSRSINTITR